MPPRSIVVTVDTLPAVFELEEILHELREYAVTLRASPFGYLFSFIRTFADAPECVLPDRRDITPATPCIAAYLRHLEAVAAKRRTPLLDAPARIRLLFDDERPVEAADLLQVPRGRITVSGMRAALDSALRFLAGDATVDRIDAEFARAQLWQWVRHETGVLDTGRIIGTRLFGELLAEEVARLGSDDGGAMIDDSALTGAARRLESLTTAAELAGTIDTEGDTDGA
ncbi:MAG: hypothetical protein R3176_07100 [Woeseiaceae bacterium]|nr:hypothetical protein [Woeseiaceae bacterium]